MKMKLELLPAREAIARQGGVVHVAVRATPPPIAGRNPVALSIAVDSSGSMGEPAGRGAEGQGAPSKMRFVKDAAHFLVDLLEDGDQLAIVAFEDTARSVLRPVMVGAGSRAEIHAAIESLGPGGRTNLMVGLELALLDQPDSGAHSIGARVVLLSDGETNTGETRPEVIAARAAEAAAAGTTVSSVGVGLGYNVDLLRAIADAGGGEYHHVETPRSAEQALIQELFGAAEAWARAVEVEFTVPAPAVLGGPNLNGYPETAVAGGARVQVGDLVRARTIVFEIATPFELGSDVLRAEARVVGRTADGEVTISAGCALRAVAADEVDAAGLDPDVVELVLRLLQARAETAFAASADRGDAVGAKSALSQARSAISLVTDRYGPESLGYGRSIVGEFDRLEAQLDAGQFDTAAAKPLFASARAHSRSMSPTLPVAFERSYWVDAPNLLAGCYPGDLDPVVAERKLRGLADAGIRTIVNLMVPGETSHGGRPFHPYAAAADRLGLSVLSHPVPDGGVVDQATLGSILDSIDAATATGSPVYVHCWGGRGRTGMVIGCWLVRHGRAAPDTAISRLRSLRRDCPDANLPSPDNRAQGQVVKSWLPGQ